MTNDKKKKNIAVIGGWGSAPYAGDKSRPLDEVYGVSNEKGGGFLTPKGEKDIYGSTEPYDAKEAPKSEAAKSGFGSRISERAKLERLRATRAALDKKPAESPYIPKPYPKPEKSDVKSAEGKTSQSSGAKTVKSASDKSRLAPKTTNFERMKARQFEKEGYAGRSLTRAQAQKLAGVKSGSNTSSLMSLFGISKKKTETPKAGTPKKLTSDFAKKNLAANQKIGKSK